MGLCAFGVRGMQAQGFQPARGAAASPDPPERRSDSQATSPGARSARPTWAAASTTSRSSRAIPPPIYVGFATGGLWKTVNNGTTWTPLFDEQPVPSIGDVDGRARRIPNVVYVGTGEPNNRQSSSFGAGVYKSTDAGKTWKYMGLKETQSIARIVDPSEGSEHRLRRGGRAPLRAEPGTRPLQDDRRRRDLDEHQVHRPGHGLHRRRDAIRSTRTSSTRRRTSAGGSRGASTAAVRAAASGRRRTAAKTLDAADGQRPARQPDHRAHRPRPRALEAADDLRVD